MKLYPELKLVTAITNAAEEVLIAIPILIRFCIYINFE